MCKDCGCPAHGSSQVKFFVKGAGDNARDVEKSLRALPGVYFISINNLDGLTTVFYDPNRTTFAEITAALAAQGVQTVA
jgi:copper chaperone CopZ